MITSDLITAINPDWMTEIPAPRLIGVRGRKGRKRARSLRWSETETVIPHRTRNGRGCVARLTVKP